MIRIIREVGQWPVEAGEMRATLVLWAGEQIAAKVAGLEADLAELEVAVD